MYEFYDKIAFVILNYNNYKLTLKCYEDIKKLYSGFNIVIVDNNSTDLSKVELKKIEHNKNTHVILNDTNLGYAAGNNIGLKYIRKKLINVDVSFIINPDVFISRLNIIDNLYSNLISDTSLASITALTIYNNKINFPNESCWRLLDKNQVYINSSIVGKILKKDLRYQELSINDENVAYVDVLQGCFFGIKMDVLERIGYLDEETFLYCEEQILAFKIKNINMNSGILITEFINHNHFEKDKTMLEKKTKIFHLKCLKNSRKVIIKKYLNLNIFEKIVRNIFLELDFFIKKILIR